MTISGLRGDVVTNVIKGETSELSTMVNNVQTCYKEAANFTYTSGVWYRVAMIPAGTGGRGDHKLVLTVTKTGGYTTAYTIESGGMEEVGITAKFSIRANNSYNVAHGISGIRTTYNAGGNYGSNYYIEIQMGGSFTASMEMSFSGFMRSNSAVLSAPTASSGDAVVRGAYSIDNGTYIDGLRIIDKNVQLVGQKPATVANVRGYGHVAIVSINGDGGTNSGNAYCNIAFGTKGVCIASFDASGNSQLPSANVASSNLCTFVCLVWS